MTHHHYGELAREKRKRNTMRLTGNRVIQLCDECWEESGLGEELTSILTHPSICHACGVLVLPPGHAIWLSTLHRWHGKAI